ncbi:hypothetical protein A2W45_03430 [Candidatus Curtissbacteria bacterium RIFCSPHIGHO2_12_41_11]|uniref:Ribose-5-phosphate isomerase n=3 Tax=Candidatus Curtissiibacteriota TaxID=1752717 RepID=A0A1F5HT96_9BACT|nr:MAG: hypothetical protein A2W45_03430 [Candidatus Curtissbacteria bacterium RIFCSPHIGHO2_12_41_11]OGE07374.1 MAG: hypothetical protein A2W70_03215 [Candidatus Curtissbacteria bacterium RIFCSPLOWO2_02_41_11]
MIYIAADHAGFYLKKQLIQYLKIKGLEVEDMGAFELNEDDDYPDFVIPCALRVAESHAQGKPDDVGIVIGGSGQGEAIAANKVKGIRAAVYYGGPSTSSGSSIPRLAREHNDANILSLGARFLSADDAKKAVSVWLDTKFESGRHQRRVDKISKFENEG